MDKNKLKVLQDIGYKIQSVCSLCVYATFPNNDWGTCNVHVYNHLKHTGPVRKLTINKLGFCSKFDIDFDRLAKLESFTELYKLKEDNGQG